METRPFCTDVQPGDLVYPKALDSIRCTYEKTGSVPTLTKMVHSKSSNLGARGVCPCP